ncbi:hypothetical protein M8J77_000551 [Diaphorina citri]|nr:hypothetical protein M8J77_000551 [Diaphorina citri]
MFGTKWIPLRSAIEKTLLPKERAEEHIPLRDAVERRPILHSPKDNYRFMQQPGTKHQVVCYVEAKSAYRHRPATFNVKNVIPQICTHVIYAYAAIDPVSRALIPEDLEYDVIKGGYKSFLGLKEANPELKVYLAVKSNFVSITSDRESRLNFISSVLEMFDMYKFDGLDLNVKDPALNDEDDDDLESIANERSDFSTFIQELSSTLRRNNYQLTLTSPGVIDRKTSLVDISVVAPLVDLILLKSFNNDHMDDEVVPVKPNTKVNIQVTSTIANFNNIESAVYNWIKKGARPEQIIIGIPFFGKSYRLFNRSEYGLGATVKGPGTEGKYTQMPGYLAFFEVCNKFKDKTWRHFTDSNGEPFMVKKDEWITYENNDSIRRKMNYIKDRHLGGAMLWTLDLDDFRGFCGQKYPLLSAVVSNLQPGNVNEVFNHLKTVRNEDLEEFDEEPEPKVVCYVTNWSGSRKSDGKFVPENIDYKLCTHIVYAFASLDPNTLSIQAGNPEADLDDNFYQRISSSPLVTHGKVKILIAIGGWTDSSGEKYSQLISSGTNRKKFIKSVLTFLRRFDFAGLHFDWNYPVCWQADCSKQHKADKGNFVKLIQELKAEFDKHDYIIAVGISGYKEILEVAYDFPALNDHVEFMSLMSYDYHGAWEGITGLVSPLNSRPGEPYPNYNINTALKLIDELGGDKRKIVIGVPFYGQSYTLKLDKEHGLGAETDGPGLAGEYTQQPGMLAYYEICYRIKTRKWTVQRNTKSLEPFTFQGDQWVSYEDSTSLTEKVKFIKSNGYAGIMAWTIDLDDFHNKCCMESFPLLRAVNRAFGRLKDKKPSAPDCTRPTVSTPSPIGTSTTEDSGSYLPPAESSSTPSHEETETTSTSTETTSRKPEVVTIATEEVSSSESPSTTQQTTSKPWWSPSTEAPESPESPDVTEESTMSSSSSKPTTSKPWWSPTTEETETVDAQPSTTESSGESEKPPTTSIDSDTDSDSCTSGEYYPVDGECGSYYRCILGTLKKESCAPGLHWNKVNKICDWPKSAKCEDKNMETPMKSTTESQSQELELVEDELTTIRTQRPTRPATSSWWTPITTTESTQEEYIPETCVNGDYLPDPDDCRSFLICSHGNLLKQSCGPSLLWNAKKKLCDWSYNVQCSLQSNIVRFSLKPKDESCQEGEFAAYPSDCNKYQYCIWGSYQVASCSPGLYWNDKMKTCDWPYRTKCKQTSATTTSEQVPKPTKKPTKPTKKPTTTTEYNPPEATTKPSTTTSTTTDSGAWTPNPTEWVWHPPTEPTTTHISVTEKSPLDQYFKIVCYFTNWAWYRPGKGKYVPEDIRTDLCTHIVYGFAVLDSENLIIKAHDSWADFDNRFYERVVTLKKKGVKVSLAIGGWNDSLGGKYSRLVNSATARQRFIEHVVKFLLKYQFDGLDLDWEYPTCWQVNCDAGPDSDKESFGLFVRELHQAFKPHGLLLSAAVSPSKQVINAAYDVKALSESLDWISVMTYDYHGQWDKKTGHVAPLYEHPDDDFFYFNANFTMNYWMKKGAPSRKLVMGMPMYGQAFSLANSNDHGLNAAAPGAGLAGEYTRQAGFLAYYEICAKIKSGQWTVVKDKKNRIGPYAYSDNQWVGYDDVDMIRTKSEFIKSMNLGGGMIWALDLDDFKNVCGEGVHPLLSTITEVLGHGPGGNYESTTEEYKPTSEESKPTSVSTSTVVTTEEPEQTEEPITTTTTSTTTTTKRPKPPTTTSTTTTRPKPITTIKPKPTTVKPKPTTTVKPKPTTVKPKPVIPPSTKDEFKIVCYFTNWAWYRQSGGKYLPSDIDSDLCTHVIYGFAVLDTDQLVIKPHDTWADLDNKFYEKVTALKKKGVKVTLAIGGWNDSAGNKYSRLVNSQQARSKFIAHVVNFILEHNFDGLDLDWEYPKCWQVDCKQGPASDKQGFADLIKELRAAFNPHDLLLSAAVSPSKAVIDNAYDIPVMSENLDWISVMTYDYHGQWDKKTGHVAPMYALPNDTTPTFNANYSLHYWVSHGADRKKVIFGMPMYGQSFTLADKNKNGLNSQTYGGAEAGENTRARGFLAYYEICDKIQKDGWVVVRDRKRRIGPYAFKGDQWVGFDDQAMIHHKAEFVKYNDLGGAMIWALDLDDFKNFCGCESYPLLKTINRVLRNYPGPGPNCFLKPVPPKHEDNVPQTTGTQYEEDETLSDDTIVIDSKSNRCNRTGELYQHEGDCAKFASCENGLIKIYDCPPGLHFNFARSICDWPFLANCDKRYRYNLKNMKTAVLPMTERKSDLVLKDSSQKKEEPYKVICYYTSWAYLRQAEGKYSPEDIDGSLCTHLVYAFADLDEQELVIRPHNNKLDLEQGFYEKITKFNERGIQVILAIGGWSDSRSDKYSRLVNDIPARRNFVRHVTEFLEFYGFNGLEFAWEYPKCWQTNCKKGPDADKVGFTLLMKELSFAFKPRQLSLSAVVSPSQTIIDQAYNVKSLAKYLDWVTVLSFDYSGYWDGATGHVAPLYQSQDDQYHSVNTNFSINYWISKGMPARKVIMGMPLYAQTFILADSNSHGLNALTVGPGLPGPFTQSPGFMAYYETCSTVKSHEWTVVRDSLGARGPYAYNGKLWLSYDDTRDIRRKCKSIKQDGLGGAMVWSIDLDDFQNLCSCGPYPLLSAVNYELRNTTLNYEPKDCT